MNIIHLIKAFLCGSCIKKCSDSDFRYKFVTINAIYLFLSENLNYWTQNVFFLICLVIHWQIIFL